MKTKLEVQRHFSITAVWSVGVADCHPSQLLCGGGERIYELALERREEARSLLVLFPLSAARKLTTLNDAIVVTSGYRWGDGVVNLVEFVHRDWIDVWVLNSALNTRVKRWIFGLCFFISPFPHRWIHCAGQFYVKTYTIRCHCMQVVGVKHDFCAKYCKATQQYIIYF